MKYRARRSRKALLVCHKKAEDEKHGSGRHEWTETKEAYEGKYKKGKRSGRGKLFKDGVLVYDGLWAEDEAIDGNWAAAINGEMYDGDWVSGKYHGYGKVKRADGEQYEGEFENGAYCGWGRLTKQREGKFVGEFKDGLLCGTGSSWEKDSICYEGGYKAGKRHGMGTLFHVEMLEHPQMLYDGAWQGGEKHGKGVEIVPDVVVITPASVTASIARVLSHCLSMPNMPSQTPLPCPGAPKSQNSESMWW